MQHFNKHIKLLVAFLSIFSYAQAQDFEWVKLLKPKTPAGAILNSPVANTTTKSVCDNENNIYSIGTMRGQFDPFQNNQPFTAVGADVYITKYKSNGTLEWMTLLGGKSAEMGQGIALDSQNNIYITGLFTDSMDVNTLNGTVRLIAEDTTPIVANNRNGFIAKLNNEGKVEWIKKIGNGGQINLNGLRISNNSQIIIAGNAAGRNVLPDYDPGPQTFNLPFDSASGAFICSYDLDGNFNWGKGINNCNVRSFSINKLNEIVLAGLYSGIVDFDPSNKTHWDTVSSNFAFFVLSLDKEGNFQWVKKLLADNTNTTWNSIYLTTDPNNNILLTGGHHRGLTFDTFSFVNTRGTSTTPYLIKMNREGNYIWAHTFLSYGTHNTNASNAVAADNCGNIYITGEVRNSTVEFNPNTATDTVRSTNSQASFIAKYDSDGNFNWVYKLNQSNFVSIGTAITLGNDNSVYFQGSHFGGTIDFGLKGNNDTATGSTGSFYTVKYGCGANSSPETINEEICEGSTFIFGQDALKAPGTYTKHFCNISRCDSMVILNLSFSELTEPLITVSEKTLSTSDEYASYQWMLDGNIIPGATNATYFVTENGKYQVIISTDKGCVDTSDEYVVNNANSIENLNGADDAITVYPNPAKTAVQFVHHTDFNNTTIKLINVVGQTIITTNSISGKSFQMDVQNITPGVYIAEITDGDKTYRKSIVKE